MYSILGIKYGGQFIFAALVASIPAVLIALICHEVAHAFAALKAGDPSAKMAKRLSFNPARHLDPFGFACFYIGFFGWAKPVPVNPFNYKNFRKGNFWVSTAGIFTNLVLGIIFSLAFFFFNKYVTITTQATFGNVALFGIGYFFRLGMLLNFCLMIFNLLPIPPLDGYNMLVSFTKPDNKFMQFMRRNAMYILVAVLIISWFTGFIGILVNGIEGLFLRFWELLF